MVVTDGHRNLAATRNAGVAACTGEIVVTIDADTVMHPDALAEVDRLSGTGKYVGGGCRWIAFMSGGFDITRPRAPADLDFPVARIGLGTCRQALLGRPELPGQTGVCTWCV